MSTIKRIPRTPLSLAASASVVKSEVATKTKVKKTTITKLEKNGKYGNPWQTKPTPPETDSLRKFYMTLLNQKPDSAMAMKWCLEHGLLNEKRSFEAMMILSISKLKV